MSSDGDSSASAICASCKQLIEGKILSALGKKYHPDHFTCTKCNLPIKDDKFQQNNGYPYCEEDYAKLFLKRCYACKMPIKQKMIKALGVEWHEEHFVCTICKKILSGISFLEKDGFPYCEKDYHNIFSDKCKACGNPIVDKAVIALDEKWHHDCFKCKKCRKPVTDDSFQVENGAPICAKCT